MSNPGRRFRDETVGQWNEQAACRSAPDPEIFFAAEFVAGSPRRMTQQTLDALDYCRVCVVLTPCLQSAMSRSADDDWGVYGGTTERQRREHRRNRGRGAA